MEKASRDDNLKKLGFTLGHRREKTKKKIPCAMLPLEFSLSEYLDSTRRAILNALDRYHSFEGFTIVADPDPGSGAFLTPGSGIRNKFFPDPGSRIPDPKTIFLRAF